MSCVVGVVGVTQHTPNSDCTKVGTGGEDVPDGDRSSDASWLL